MKKHHRPLYGKVRCGVCGHAMQYTNGKQKYLFCRTPRDNAAYTCADRMPVIDILETVSEGLHMRALMAVELRRLWAEQHRGQEKDTAAMRRTLSELREKHGQRCQQIKGLYESFALGEIGKPEYLAAKAAAVQQRDTAAVRIAELEAALENTGSNGGLQNGFVSTFGKYIEIEEITSEIVTEVLKEVRIYPGGRLEIIWNLQDDLEKLVLTLQGDHQNGT